MNQLKISYCTIIIVFMVLFNLETTLAQPQEVTFTFTGAQQSFIVPPGVNTIHIQAWGAQGSDVTSILGTGLGGLGGFAEGDLEVAPGQTLEIFVGGQGTPAEDGATTGGGFNGGGNAGSLPGSNFTRGGGGGASDVRVGGTTLDHRIIVAGGGGGASGRADLFGGAGGGFVGEDGEGLFPGDGGTQTAGGAGGLGICFDGEFGVGGSTMPATQCCGGGGGWYGGGGGVGAGGGSSYIGGVENGETNTGLREGDGLIVLMFKSNLRNVPTLSEWGLITMASILGIVGFIAVRRKNALA